MSHDMWPTRGRSAEVLNMAEQEWLSTVEAAVHIGVDKKTLYKLVDSGLIKAYRPSRSLRFRRTDLDTYLESVVVRPGDISHLRWPVPSGTGRDTADGDS